jgi:hypothetical protein
VLKVVCSVETAAVAVSTGRIVIIHRRQRHDAGAWVVSEQPGFFSDDLRKGMEGTPAEQTTTAAPDERRSARRG